jgi:DNA-binding beta-propeller fold protein YncE
MPNRVRYNVAGSPTMVLAPDGSKLFVSSYRPLGGPNTAYWLAAADPRLLHAVGPRVPLAGCGPPRLATAAQQVVALCTDSNDVTFVDPATSRVTSRVALPAIRELYVEGKAFQLAVSSDGTQVYVVTNDQRIVVIDAVSHRLVRQVTAYRGAAQTVPVLYSVARTSDGAHLIVGVMARPRDPVSPFSLRVFALPSLVLERTVPLPGFVHFIAGPNGGLFTFSMLDSPNPNVPIQHLSANAFGPQAAGQLRGPLTAITVP